MSYQWIVLLVGSAWVAIGLTLALVMGRRGHNAFSWGVMGALLGPFALVLAVEAVMEEGTAKGSVLDPGVPQAGDVDVLVGVDGSPESAAALDAALAILGHRLGRITLAGVADYDRVLGVERELKKELERQADHVRSLTPRYELASAPAAQARCGVALLVGDPADVLAREVSEGGYDLLVVGARGRGLAKSLLGSVASRLAASGKVPVLIGPSAS